MKDRKFKTDALMQHQKEVELFNLQKTESRKPESHQLEAIIELLIDIRSLLQDEPKKADENNTQQIAVHNLRNGIFHQLESQTSWGRNQIKKMINNLIESQEEE